MTEPEKPSTDIYDEGLARTIEELDAQERGQGRCSEQRSMIKTTINTNC
jgi:hypothetical protein